jgi:HD-GYP domain-containing protein (c-di-GMP phosphodiesterase class II)
VRHHHERWDGRGYPSGLEGDGIPLGARIILVADAFDAMTSDRPYRRALSREEALAEVERCSGTQFDPEIVRVFLALFAEAERLPAAAAS